MASIVNDGSVAACGIQPETRASFVTRPRHALRTAPEPATTPEATPGPASSTPIVRGRKSAVDHGEPSEGLARGRPFQRTSVRHAVAVRGGYRDRGCPASSGHRSACASPPGRSPRHTIGTAYASHGGTHGVVHMALPGHRDRTHCRHGSGILAEHGNETRRALGAVDATRLPRDR